MNTVTLQTKLDNSTWYRELIEDLKQIIVEGVFNSNWYLIETYHAVGMRILKDHDHYGKRNICNSVAKSLGKSTRTIYQAIQFARLYPDLGRLPEGKNTNWHRICNKYLTNGEDKEKLPKLTKCPKCGYEWDSKNSLST